MAAYAGKLPPSSWCCCSCYCSFIHIYLECNCCCKGSRGCVCVCVWGSCAASSTELSKKMPPASPVLLSQRESVPTSLPSFLFPLFFVPLSANVRERAARERERAWELFFAIHAKDTENIRCCCLRRRRCLPATSACFCFCLCFFIRFKGINLMKFVAQL